MFCFLWHGYRYIIFLGLDQNYSMFAPKVRKTNRSFFALITFRDLSTAIWSYPRLDRMPLLQAMQKERYRKFANDNIVTPSFAMFLPDFARYIARNHVCPNNKPEFISIYLVESDIPELLQRTKPRILPTASEPSCRLTNIFTYQVEANDLVPKFFQ
jgi:hypothetical protein